MSIEAMKRWLEALEEAHYKIEHKQDEKKREKAIAEIRKAIEQAQNFADYVLIARELGMPCPDCTVRLPKAPPKILIPNQKCWCGYRDNRPRQAAHGITGEQK